MKNLTEKQKQEVIREATVGITTTAAFVAAVRNARKGRWERATFYLLLWQGFAANAESTRNYKRYQETVEHRKCEHLNSRLLAGLPPE